MKFIVEKKDDYTSVKVTEPKLDTHIALALKSELILVAGSGEKNIMLDISACNYCDSSGLSAILVGNRLCKNEDGIFLLAGIQPAVERLISISQLDSVLNISYNIDVAEETMISLLDK